MKQQDRAILICIINSFDWRHKRFFFHILLCGGIDTWFEGYITPMSFTLMAKQYKFDFFFSLYDSKQIIVKCIPVHIIIV